jgi:hypothetical protein
LIEVYKMMTGLSRLSFGTFFEFSNEVRTRGNKLKLVKKQCRLDLRQHFFSERVINTWNKLGDEVVMSASLNGFKSRLEGYRHVLMDPRIG